MVDISESSIGRILALESENSELKKKVSMLLAETKHDETYFKKAEKKKIYNPISWFRSDKTNPLIMVVLSPAGDLTIRERVVDHAGNLSLGKNTLYRTEYNEIWDIAESDVTGFKGKRILFYFQDNPNPIRIRRDDTKQKVTVNTETYAKSQKSHLLSELLSPEMSFSDYLTMIMVGANILLSLVIVFKIFFMDKTGGASP
jgi:hypothetical protein